MANHPPCPHCGKELPFALFNKLWAIDALVDGALRLVFDRDDDRPRRRRARPIWSCDPRLNFALMCEHCGATAAVDVSQDNAVSLAARPDPQQENADGSTPLWSKRALKQITAEVRRLDRILDGGESFETAPPAPHVPLDAELAAVADRIDAEHAAARNTADAADAASLRFAGEPLSPQSSVIVCSQCREDNQSDFERCWQCDAPLAPAG
jgi:hypothetical protein